MENKFKFFFSLSLLLVYFKCEAQSIDLKKIEYNAKFICFSDFYLRKMDIKSDSSLLTLFHNFDKHIYISYPKSKGFTLIHDTMFFISVYLNSSTKLMSQSDSIKSKTNMYSNFCEYIICCTIKNNICNYYKIKGFQVNEYSLVLNELLNQFTLNPKEIKNIEGFCYTHKVEGIDIKCLHSKYLNSNNKTLSDCCISCLNRENQSYTIYLLEDGRKIFNETKEKLKSLEGYFLQQPPANW